MRDVPVLPDPVPDRRWWIRLVRAGYCPACGTPWANSRWTMSIIGYPMHYAVAHLGIEPFRRQT